PAIFEELLFRGALLSGLAGQRTWARVLVVAVAFGIFHVSFFRFLPTAFLGALLALATIWTGSIFPAMAWHAANNAIAAFVLEDMERLPVWAFTVALPGLAIALYLLWRASRTRTQSPAPID
ncbi:MAG TPA: CPBP family intramembrane glutamic endopeptidase, partial [Thermoanaerobaculia bacterium]|nr:CPBP family intramembrane glutamic endopeptidase [Thermoanaerobaculia bacterium]